MFNYFLFEVIKIGNPKLVRSGFYHKLTQDQIVYRISYQLSYICQINFGCSPETSCCCWYTRIPSWCNDINAENEKKKKM